ncbi:MAG: DUF6468 domain-containing protein [Lentilitoribacter sp.]
MAFIADLLLVAGALAAGFYCFVLSKRLSALQNAEGGVGQVVAALSAQVDELSRSLDTAQLVASSSNESLNELTGRAEDVAQRLELMVAAMHDIPATNENIPQKPAEEGPVFSTRVGSAAGF